MGFDINYINATCYSCNDGLAKTWVANGTSPYTYLWTPNGETSATISNLTPGNYGCCVTDANGCIICTTINIQPDTPQCFAYFTVAPDTSILHTYWLTNYALGVSPIHYHWIWGDSTFTASDTLPYPSHTYAVPDYYIITLQITDSTGCTSEYVSEYYLARGDNYMLHINVQPPGGFKNKESTKKNLSIYPNPVSKEMTINYYLSNASDIHINVYDLLGNKIKEIVNTNQSEGQHSILWNVSTIPQGIYLVQFIGDNKILNQKIDL
jgi:hypothetical protein